MSEDKKPVPMIDTEMLARMRMGIAYRHPIQIRDQIIHVRPLSMGETITMANETMAELRSVPEAMRTTLNESSILARKTIVMATTSDVGMRDPQLTEHSVDRMTPEEVQFYYQQYVDVVRMCDPAVESFPEKDVEELVAQVKKNRELLTALSRLQLLVLARYFLTSEDSPADK
jgi:hypothetical protein